MILNDRDLLFEMKNVIPEREREAIMRLTMCARRNCAICIYGHNRKRVTVKLPQSCLDRITENMNILAAACEKKQNILFLCDKRKCDICHSDFCRHTTDISHAVGFVKTDYGCFAEIEDNGERS